MRKVYTDVKGSWKLTTQETYSIYYTSPEGLKKFGRSFFNVSENGAALMQIATLLLKDVEYGSLIVSKDFNR